MHFCESFFTYCKMHPVSMGRPPPL